jgi:glutamine amidotransferase
MIIIVDYGQGNLGSIKNMLRKLGFLSEITSEYQKIANASKLILPGVGAFDGAMTRLRDLGLIDLLNRMVLIDKIPILGICLGAQIMCNRSEEGTLKGFGWFDADVLSFKGRFGSAKLPVPNIGWRIVQNKKNHSLINMLPNESRFYFVHSFFISPNHEEDILLTSNYGFLFSAALQKHNIYAVQFHPEKSHRYGFQLLTNFANS